MVSIRPIMQKNLYFVIYIAFLPGLSGQEARLKFFEPSDTLHTSRLYWAAGTATLGYASASIGLYHAWYKQFPRSGFHLFNDLEEWNGMDKAGHIFSTYFQSEYGYGIGRWAGMKKSSSIWAGIIAGTLFQTTIEIMDGFSSDWGFSIADMGANFTGAGVFALQQHYWNEQKFRFKFSLAPRNYSTEPIFSSDGTSISSLQNRSVSLFGNHWAERILKDYNGHTYWLSFNIHSFFQNEKIPSWINVAFGYSAENMFGGFTNSWQENGSVFVLNEIEFPRYRQYFLSLDIDLSKIQVKNHFLKTLLTALNIQKIPAPAIEITSHGNVIFHFLKF